MMVYQDFTESRMMIPVDVTLRDTNGYRSTQIHILTEIISFTE